MLNVLGGNKVYTVPEIDKLIKNMAGFEIVDKLPTLDAAKTTCVYYKRGNSSIIDGYRKPDDPDGDATEDVKDEADDTYTTPIYRQALIPYIKAKQTSSGTSQYVWFTTDTLSKVDSLTEEDVRAIWYYGVTYDGLTSEQKNADGSVKEIPIRYTSINTTRHIAINTGA